MENPPLISAFRQGDRYIVTDTRGNLTRLYVCRGETYQRSLVEFLLSQCNGNFVYREPIPARETSL